MSTTVTTVELDDESDRWRYRCPNGHTDWEPTNHHFWCASCARTLSDQVDPEFKQLHDKREGRTLEREEVRLVLAEGSYVDLYKGGETA
ncbi:hypothetical protein [Halolamina sp.]|uniref:hypothetical protein n=1 Tax=Halolamina sp. TaxID=1940283 RepID=UPI00356A7B15